MNQNKPPQGQQINIELGEKEAEGIYSNLAIITHSPAEFIIDFTRIVPGVPKAKVLSRIITTPQHAKMLMKALKDNIEKFEARFGEIKMEIPQDQHFGFVPPKAKVLSRIITTPQHAKMLLKALKDNIEKFEARFGEIKMEIPQDQHFGFVPPKGPEKVN